MHGRLRGQVEGVAVGRGDLALQVEGQGHLLPGRDADEEGVDGVAGLLAGVDADVLPVDPGAQEPVGGVHGEPGGVGALRVALAVAGDEVGEVLVQGHVVGDGDVERGPESPRGIEVHVVGHPARLVHVELVVPGVLAGQGQEVVVRPEAAGTPRWRPGGRRTAPRPGGVTTGGSSRPGWAAPAPRRCAGARELLGREPVEGHLDEVGEDPVLRRAVGQLGVAALEQELARHRPDRSGGRAPRPRSDP